MDKGFEHGSPSQIRRAIWATRGLFELLGMFCAVWGVHIPSVKQRYALGEGALSLVLVAAAVGAVSAVMFAGRVIGRLGARQTAMLCAVVMACMLGLVLHWPGLPWLLLAMLLFGASLSVFDVAINTEGSALEVAGGQPIMGSLHGMFSLGAMGGAALAARYGALSCDHIEHLSADGIAAMKAAGTVAVLLPGAYYTLRDTHLPPIAQLREAGVPMAVSTDPNPGTSPALSLLLMANMACTLFRLTVPEALAGITTHAARALGLQDSHGLIASGRPANFVLWPVGEAAELAYWLGQKPDCTIVRQGRIARARSEA